MTLYQFPGIIRMRDLGYEVVAGPFNENSPVGGPVVMMNDQQRVIRVIGDGSIEVAEWRPEVIYDDGATCGLEGCP